ncbi:MAG TPA: SdrD B-like domain-containing protein, partial [Chthonomonadaceae bacterium]|nr:SdrD B-like domain-containing protein [Chthonomonadaceae bacterium]
MKLSSKRFPFVLTLFAMLLAILTAGAGAQTVTQTQTVSVPSTALSGPYQTNLPITKFDPTLGSLQSVTITLQGDITSSMKIEVIDTIGHSVGATASGTLMLERPDLSNIVTLTPTSTVGPLALQPFVQFQNGAFVGDLVVDYGGTSGHDFGQITATGSLNALLSLPGDLALFTGSGSIQLPFSAQASSSFSGITGLAPWNGKPWLGAPNSPGGINLKSVAQVITSSTDAKVTVVYTYIPPSVTISGAVDIDWNEDNIVDGNDTGKAGVTLQLFDSQGNPVLDSHGNPVTTTTDANGNYSFSNLLPGTYTVKETVPSGFRTAGASTTSQTVNATNSVTNANFYIVCIKSSVYGTVYFDINGNGKQDSNEPGIPGVTVILTDEDGGPCMCLDGTPVPPAVTNADGSYSFLNVCIGDGHHVTVIPPAGMTQTADPDGVLDNTTTINITPTPVLGVDFGYTGTGSISGTIFNDVNGNGVRNLPGDNGIPAGTVTLIWAGPDGVFGDGDDVVFPSVQTDSSGHYAFANLPPGNFKVVVDPTTLPSNTFPTYDLDGISTPNSAQVTLSVMGTSIPPINNVDFGYTTASTLSGYVYIDANNNGMFDGNETPIKGVSVTLTGTTNLGSPIGPITVTTDSTGAYGFGNLLPGTYTLQETQPAGYLDGKDTQGTPGTGTTGNDQFTNITLSSGVSGINNNFGELQPASLSGFVYVDANDDGMKQSTEAGIAGVTVTLKGTDDLGNAVNASTTTASDGSYSFANLRPGTYSITETPPAGYLDGKDSVGSQGTGSVGVDQISSITLNSGINGTDNDFGNLLPASLSGYVYVDANNDGIKQSTEAGIANVKITLTGSDDLGHSVNVSTTTASDGSYSFANL